MSRSEKPASLKSRAAASAVLESLKIPARVIWFAVFMPHVEARIEQGGKFLNRRADNCVRGACLVLRKFRSALIVGRMCELGWVVGFEPTTFGTTIRRSTK